MTSLIAPTLCLWYLCYVLFISYPAVTSATSCSDLNKGVQTNDAGVTTVASSQTSLKMTRQSSAGSTKQRSGEKSSRKGKDNRSKLSGETRAQKEVERRSCNNARERWVILTTLLFSTKTAFYPQNTSERHK